MALKRIGAAQLTRLETRIRVIRAAVKVAIVAFFVALGFVFVAGAIPQRRTLERMETKLKVAQEQERLIAAERDVRHIELQALHRDPAFLEIHARDRLNYYREGERVLRFKRDN